MKIWDEIKAWIEQVKEYFGTELELLKLKSVRAVSSLVSRAYALIFLVIFFNISLMLGGLWLGFFLSELLDSTVYGFGLAFASFLILFVIFIRFRRALLIHPFQNLMIKVLRESLAAINSDEREGKTK